MDASNLSSLLRSLRMRWDADTRTPEQVPAAWGPLFHQHGPAAPVPATVNAERGSSARPRRGSIDSFHTAHSRPPPVRRRSRSHVRRRPDDEQQQQQQHRHQRMPSAATWPGASGRSSRTRGGSSSSSGGSSTWSTVAEAAGPSYTHSRGSGSGSSHRTPLSGTTLAYRSSTPPSPVSTAGSGTTASSRSTRRGDTIIASRSTRGTTTTTTTTTTRTSSPPPSSSPLSSMQDYSLLTRHSHPEPTRCVLRLMVNGRTDKYIYISRSVCPSCCCSSSSHNSLRSRLCSNNRRRGSFTSLAGIFHGFSGDCDSHNRLDLAQHRTGTSDDALDVFLVLLHTLDPASAPLLPADNGRAARILAYMALFDAQLAAPEPRRTALLALAQQWAHHVLGRSLLLLPSDDEGGLASGGGEVLASLLYAAGQLRLRTLWRKTARAVVLHCPVDADGAICEPPRGGTGGSGRGEPQRLFRLVPDPGMERAARGYCRELKKVRHQVLGDIINSIYDAREAIRRKRGYNQRDPLKAQIGPLGLWPGHHDVDYRSHPAVHVSLADLIGRVKRAAAIAGSRGDVSELLELVDRIRCIVEGMQLPAV